jgi:hypothetical protein
MVRARASGIPSGCCFPTNQYPVVSPAKPRCGHALVLRLICDASAEQYFFSIPPREFFYFVIQAGRRNVRMDFRGHVGV